MFQVIKFDRPIPSCEISSLIRENGKWIYCYRVSTPFELTDSNEVELVIYEHISNLSVKTADGMSEGSANIRFKTYSEYLYLLASQYKADMDYREEWKKKNPDAKPRIVDLVNQEYSTQDLVSLGVFYISGVESSDEDTTQFRYA